MQTETVRETSVTEIVKAQGGPEDAVVVTGENFEAYADKMLAKPGAEPEEKKEPTPEEKGAAELKEIEDKKAAAKAKADADAEEIDHPEPSKKERLNSRFSELTKARKEAEAKAEREVTAAREARERADAIQQERDALKAKYEPPKSDELGPEPQPSQFTDAGEYGKALKDWTAQATRREDAKKAADAQAKQEADARTKAWTEREAKARNDIPDYEKKLADSPVMVSDNMRDAIIESEVGPQILVHLAENPDLAREFGKMTVGKMLKEFGKLEAGFLKAEKPEPALKLVPKKEVEMSDAPKPIKPLGGGGAPVVRLSGSDEVPKGWTYDDWKAAYNAGQIK